MILEIKGKRLPPLSLTVPGDYFENVSERSSYAHELVPLKNTDWPDDIKAKIAGYYKAIGVPDPMAQKLVEPFAVAFGGRNDDGASDYSRVNWDKLTDYFQWEAQAITGNVETSGKLNKVAEEKWGHRFMHYNVYPERY